MGSTFQIFNQNKLHLIHKIKAIISNILYLRKDNRDVACLPRIYNYKFMNRTTKCAVGLHMMAHSLKSLFNGFTAITNYIVI